MQSALLEIMMGGESHIQGFFLHCNNSFLWYIFISFHPYRLTDGFLSCHVESSKAGMTSFSLSLFLAIFLQRQVVFFLAFLFSFIPQRQLVFFADRLLSRLQACFLSIIPSGLLSCFLERLQSWNLVFKFSKPLSFRPLSVTYFHLSILLSFLKSGTNKRRKTTPFERCPQMSTFVLMK